MPNNLPSASPWNDCAFGNGVFVAVGIDGAATSSNGTAWTARVMPTTVSWSCIVFSAGVFVAFGGAVGKAAVSTNGISWDLVSLPVVGVIADAIPYGAGVLAVVLSPGVILVSDTGYDWRIFGAAPVSTSMRSLAFGNSKLVAPMYGSNTYATVFDNTRTLTTLSTLTQPTKPNPGSNFATITVTGQSTLQADDAIDCWIQGTDSTTDHNAYEHQVTPIRLAITNVIAGVGFDITAYSDLRLDGAFQVRWAWVGGVGEKTGSAVINFPDSAQAAEYRSSVSVVDSWPNPSAATKITIASSYGYGVSFGNGVFVAHSNISNSTGYSYDGLSWALTTGPSINAPSNAYFLGSYHFAVFNTNTAIYRSSGVGGWTACAIPTTRVWQSMAFGNGVYVTTADATTGYATSPDAITWVNRVFPSSGNWRVAYGAGVFVAIQGSTALRSTDGVTWDTYTLPTTKNWLNLTYGVGKFVAVVPLGDTTIVTSDDGITWVAGVAGSPLLYTSAIYGTPERIIVTTTSNIVLISPDCLSWTQITIPNLTAVPAYGLGKFICTTTTVNVGYTFSLNTRTTSTVNTLTNEAAPVPGTNSTSTQVTGLTTFNATDAVEVWVQGSDTTADHNEVEHALAPIQLRATNPVTGVGFTINATSPHRLDGDFKVRYAFTP
jgi:hypothetical protein